MRAAAILTLWTLLSGPAEPHWHTDYAPALAESVQKGKPLLILFEEERCLYCERQHRELKHVDLSGVVLLKVQKESSTVLVPHFGVHCFPTIMLAAPDGWVKDTLIGLHDHKQVQEAISRARK